MDLISARDIFALLSRRARNEPPSTSSLTISALFSDAWHTPKHVTTFGCLHTTHSTMRDPRLIRESVQNTRAHGRACAAQRGVTALTSPLSFRAASTVR